MRFGTGRHPRVVLELVRLHTGPSGEIKGLPRTNLIAATLINERLEKDLGQNDLIAATLYHVLEATHVL